MVTKVGKQLFAMNAGDTVFPQMRVPNIGWIPGRRIASDTPVYFNNSKMYGGFQWLKSVANTRSYGVAFGSGTTPATDTDYNMESIIDPTDIAIQVSTVEQAYDSETQNTYAYYNYTITNNSQNDLTISEMGLFGAYRAAYTSGGNTDNNNDYTVMLDHTVLEDPVTIPAGEVGIIQYRFESPLN